jgi:hypothetical protein
MQHPNHADPDHSNHDSNLIAGHAAGDLTDSERSRAQALVETCSPCAELHRDLIAIAAATRSLPNLAKAPRDFRLDAEQAARLRRGTWLRTALRPFAASGSATRPLAAAFTSLGIAGVFVVTILPGLLGGPASMSAERQSGSAGAPASTNAPAGTVVPVAAPGSVTGLGNDATSRPGYDSGTPRPDGPEEVDPNDTKVDPAPTVDSEAAVAGGVESPDTDLQSDDGGRLVTNATPPNPILVGSLALLAIGVLLFGLRFAARRIR